MSELTPGPDNCEPYYQDELTTIYLGDCLDWLPAVRLIHGPPDLIVTSPPYNKGLRIDGCWQGRVTASSKGSRFRGGYGKHGDMMPMPEYEAWQKQVLQACWDHLDDHGAIFYNHKPRVLNGELWMPFMADFPLRQIITWVTGPGINVMPTAFTPAYEWVLVYAREKWQITHKASARGDVWKFAPEKMKDHPAPFPVGLPLRAIEATDAQYVVDPFMGSGSSLVAAKLAGRHAVGIEVEERYCEMAAKRLAQGVLVA